MIELLVVMVPVPVVFTWYWVRVKGWRGRRGDVVHERVMDGRDGVVRYSMNSFFEMK